MPAPRLSRAEISKDTVQGAVVVVADTVGEVAGILANAVKEVAGSVGAMATELFELRDSARRAYADQGAEMDDGDQRPRPTGPRS